MTNLENKKVLVLALSGIGNLIMQLPAIEKLKKSHPDWKITVWVAPRGTRAIARQSSAIDEVIEEPIRQSWWKQLKFIAKLRRNHFDIGIMLSPGQLVKGAACLWLAGIPTRIGYRYPLFGKETGFLLTNAPKENSTLHDLEQNLKLLEPLKIRHSDLDIRHYTISVPLSAQKHADDFLKRLKSSQGKKLIGFHAGSAPDFVWKRWPLAYWTELGQALVSKNYHILIFGGKDEAKLKRKLQARIGKDASLVETDLLTCAAIMQHCEFFVSNDSGLMHLAAAAGIKTFGLFGPTDESQTGPRGSHSYVIRMLGTFPSYHTEKNYNLGNKPDETLKALAPDYVLSKIS